MNIEESISNINKEFNNSIFNCITPTNSFHTYNEFLKVLCTYL